MADTLDPSILDVMMGTQPGAQELAGAISAQLRKKQLLAEMGATVPALAGTAQLQARDVAGQQRELAQAGAAQLHYGQEARALRQSLEMMKQQGALTRAMLGAQVPNFYTDQWGRVINRKTGAVMSGAPGGDGALGDGSAPPLKPGDAQKKTIEFTNKYNAGLASSRSQFGSNQGIVNRGNRLVAQIKSVGGNPIPQEMVEDTAQLVGMLVGTNAPAVRTIHEMTPTSLGGDVAKIKQWLTGTPTGAGQQEFVKRWLKTIAREQDVASETNRNTMLQAVPAYAPYFRANKAAAAGALKQMGLDPYVDLETFDVKPPPTNDADPLGILK